MKSISELQEDLLATKCAALLKDLLVIEGNAATTAQDHSYSDKHNDNTTRNELTVKVPYLGVIRITPEGITAIAYSKADENSSL